MDKIDVVLYKFKMERRVSKEYRKMYLKTLPLIIIFLILDIILMVFSPTWFVLGCILYLVFLLVLSRIMEGKWGTNKWKYEYMKIFRENLKSNQMQLIEIIKDEGMNCQQVYNLLTKRHSKMVNVTDKQSLIISIFSLVIACTSILASPLQKANLENYTQYVVDVIIILFFLGIIASFVYRLISAQSKHYDEKKKDYEYVLKLLEDYLY